MRTPRSSAQKTSRKHSYTSWPKRSTTTAPSHSKISPNWFTKHTTASQSMKYMPVRTSSSKPKTPDPTSTVGLTTEKRGLQITHKPAPVSGSQGVAPVIPALHLNLFTSITSGHAKFNLSNIGGSGIVHLAPGSYNYPARRGLNNYNITVSVSGESIYMYMYLYICIHFIHLSRLSHLTPCSHQPEIQYTTLSSLLPHFKALSIYIFLFVAIIRRRPTFLA